MKIFYILIFVISHLVSYSQKGNIYNTKIGKANKVEIKDGVINITHADTVIVKIYISNNSPLFLSEINQIVDSIGNYVTIITLLNPEDIYKNIDIKLKFTESVESLDWIYEGAYMGEKGFSNGRKEYTFSALKVNAKNGMKAIILSKKKIEVSIEGIQGIL